jgi:hypothetical protein
MDAGRIHPDKERFPRLHLALDEIDCRLGGLIVDRLDPFFSQRAGILDLLLANPPETRVDGLVVDISGGASEHARRAEAGAEPRVLGVVGVLRVPPRH